MISASNQVEKIVVALGGNALIKQNQHGTVYEQFANTRASLVGVVELIRRGHTVILTHGNGPQVGNILIRVEEAIDKAYDVPLGVCVAQSQGEMGYMIQQSLQNALHLRGIAREVVTLVTQVIVDRDDPSIKNPTKPIGPFYNREQAQKLIARGIHVVEDAGRGYRRVVPSPIPKGIVETKVIKRLFDAGVILVVVGGGGMPVYVEEDGRYEGVDAVVDKDLSSYILARDMGAAKLVFLTGVEKVKLNFQTAKQRDLDRVRVNEAKKYLQEGQFAAGSMAPKMEASIKFLAHGGKEALITLPEKLVEAFDCKTGTHIYP